MDQITPIDIVERVERAAPVGRRSGGQGLLRRLMRAFIFLFSYHVVLSRKSIRTMPAAGFRLTVRPTVFHPRFFISSERFAQFIDGLDLAGKRVLDVGTGSGILALAAARAGAESVIAADINPNAALNAAENAHANGFSGRVTALCSNLLTALAPRPLFDVILSSPPKHAGEPRDLTDRGWHAGPAFRDIAAIFDQARARLNPSGRMYVMLSSDSDLPLFRQLFETAGFHARVAREYSILIESFIIFELTAG